MDENVPEEDIIERGPKATIAYARDERLRAWAQVFLTSDECKEKYRRRLAQAFKVLAEHGVIRNKETFKKEKGEIWGFKAHQARVAAFRVGRVWFLTHGFPKKVNKWPSRELDRAERIRSEHMKRTKKDKEQ